MIRNTIPPDTTMREHVAMTDKTQTQWRNGPLPTRLRADRAAMHITQHEVCKRAGGNMMATQLSGWENGVYKPSLKYLTALARIYRQDLAEYVDLWERTPVSPRSKERSTRHRKRVREAIAHADAAAMASAPGAVSDTPTGTNDADQTGAARAVDALAPLETLKPAPSRGRVKRRKPA